MAVHTDEYKSAKVEVVTLQAKEEAANSCSAYKIKETSIERTTSSFGSFPSLKKSLFKC